MDFRFHIYIILIFFVFLVSNAYSLQDIEVKPNDENLIETIPQKTVTCFFLIQNNTSTQRRLISNIILPPGWESIVHETNLQIDANQTLVDMVSFYVPHSTQTGLYSLIYSLRYSTSLSYFDTTEIQIFFLKKNSLCKYWKFPKPLLPVTTTHARF